MRKYIFLIVTVLLNGCMSPETNKAIVKESMQKHLDQEMSKRAAAEKMTFTQIPFEEKRDISLSVVNAPFMQIVEQTAARLGWTVKILDKVNPQDKVSLTMKNADAKTVITEAAFAAGYVAIIKDKTVTIAKSATYTFRIPSALLVDEKADVDVGGNPAKLQSGGGSSMGGGQPRPQGIDSQYKVTLKYDGVKKEFIQAINNVAGENSQVQIVGDIGLITMRGNAQSLKRVHDYINEVARSAMMVIDMEVTIMEVSLTGELQYGVNWQNIKLDSAIGTRDTTLGINGSSLYTGNGNGVGLGYSEASSGLTGASGIINALEKRTTINIKSKQAAQAANGKTAFIFDGRNIPYLGSVTPAVAGLTSSSGAAQLSFAQDGLMLSVRPEVMNDGKTIMFTILPVQMKVNGIVPYDAGNGIKLQGPDQSVKQSFSVGYANDGETIIMANSNSSSEQNQAAGIPGLIDVPVLGDLTGGKADTGINREVVILLTPRIKRAPASFDALVNASI
jgi:type II secretory pathway component GspD/PulD (secretin)